MGNLLAATILDFWDSAPRLPDSFAGVAQLVEHLPSKQTVVGSSPIARSRLIKAAGTTLQEFLDAVHLWSEEQFPPFKPVIKSGSWGYDIRDEESGLHILSLSHWLSVTHCYEPLKKHLPDPYEGCTVRSVYKPVIFTEDDLGQASPVDFIAQRLGDAWRQIQEQQDHMVEALLTGADNNQRVPEEYNLWQKG